MSMHRQRVMNTVPNYYRHYYDTIYGSHIIRHTLYAV
jgi:hypothetical protein